MGIALLGGGAGPGSAARAEALRHVLGPLLGTERPFSPFMPPEQLAHGRLARVEPKEGRAQAEAAAKGFMRAFLEGDYGSLVARSAPTLWVLWPSGQLGHHASPDCLSELSDRKTSALEAKWRSVRSYTREELRLATPRGVVEGLERFLALRRGLVVAGTLETNEGCWGRVMLVMIQRGEEWRSTCLPLPAFDAAHVLSRRATPERDEGAYAAERIVRGVVYGHRSILEADRHLLVDPLWLTDELLPVSRLLRAAGGGEERMSSLDISFMGTKAFDLSRLAKSIPRRIYEQLEAEAPAMFRRSLAKLDARTGVTVLGVIDPVRLTSEPRQEALTWLVKLADGRGRPRTMVAGVFI